MDAELLDSRVNDAAVDSWMNQQAESQDSVDREDALVESLRKLNPPQPHDDEVEKPANDNVEQSPTKKPRLSGEATESKGQEEDKHNQKPRTLKDLALFILDHCKDEDLTRFSVVIAGFLRKEDTKEEFKAKITQCDNDNIYAVAFKGAYYTNDGDVNPEEAYSNVERMFSPLADLQGALKELFESNQVKNEDDKAIMPWDECFVIAETGEQVDGINFPGDLEKGHAVIITGESGSGKSWFAKKTLPSKHPDASFIYHELGDNDAEFATFKPKDEELGYAYQKAMKALTMRGEDDTLVYQAVSELARKNNCERNRAAVEKFKTLMLKAVKGSSTVEAWWDPKKKRATHKLEKLVIIIDEVGKAPDLARGLVDEVRQISSEICNRGLAKNVMLVLVGAGLDHFIGEGSLDFEVKTGADADERALFAKFGTDPGKSHLTVLKGPNLENRNEICEILMTDIMKGTYSQVLATNTRMLTRGVIPILKSRLNTLRVDNLSSRRVELGSTNVVMDYAARVYIELNGLSRLQLKEPEKFEAFLLKQFRLLVFGEMHNLRDFSNPAFECPFSFSACEYEAVLRAGLITADIRSTSKALRYLACKGQTAPLDAQDGVAFEIVLQHHLVRLCRAGYGFLKEKDKQDPNYYCDRYALVQTWPPLSTKKEGLGTEDDVKNEGVSRFSNERKKNRPKKDADEIAKLLKNKGEYDLVLRQTVGNVLGADVLVLSKRIETKDATLDLYQAKHYNKVPSRDSKETTGAFASLGVAYDAESASFDTEPKTGSAGYSYMGTEKFVKELSDALGYNVRVRNRVVVFSEGWKSFLKSKSWKAFDFEVAKSINVWIWTREMLEPTISALVTRPAFDVLNDASD